MTDTQKKKIVTKGGKKVVTPTAPILIPPVRPPYTGRQWDKADFPPPVTFLGPWNSGTRGMFTMDTGYGKTHWTMGLAMAMAHGREFCGWQSQKRGRVLIIEGEMSKHEVANYIRTQKRALDIKWCMSKEPFVVINWETDKPPPLDTKEGHQWVFDKIKDFEPNFIIFDNIFALTTVASASAQIWLNRVVDPLMMELSHKNIGQLWIHHTDKSGKRQHGTKAREVRLTHNLMGHRVKERGIGFNLKWTKRRGDTGLDDDYADRFISFDDGKWSYDLELRPPLSTGDKKIGRPNESNTIALAALKACHADAPNTEWISLFAFRSKAIELGVAPGATDDASANKAFRRARKNLIETGQIEENANGECRLPTADIIPLNNNKD